MKYLAATFALLLSPQAFAETLIGFPDTFGGQAMVKRYGEEISAIDEAFTQDRVDPVIYTAGDWTKIEGIGKSGVVVVIPGMYSEFVERGFRLVGYHDGDVEFLLVKRKKPISDQCLTVANQNPFTTMGALEQPLLTEAGIENVCGLSPTNLANAIRRVGVGQADLVVIGERSWPELNETYGADFEIVGRRMSPRFAFATLGDPEPWLDTFSRLEAAAIQAPNNAAIRRWTDDVSNRYLSAFR